MDYRHNIFLADDLLDVVTKNINKFSVFYIYQKNNKRLIKKIDKFLSSIFSKKYECDIGNDEEIRNIFTNYCNVYIVYFELKRIWSEKN